LQGRTLSNRAPQEDALLGAAVMSAFLKGLLLDHLTGAALGEPADALERFVQLVETFQPKR